MGYDYDVAVIGTGTSAYFVVHNCLAANLKVAVIDRREYGGTCALRGCQPKKYLVAAAAVVERCRRMQGIGLQGMPAVDWPALMINKNRFTERVPRRTETGFREKGATTLHGVARFTGPNVLSVAGREISARHIVIATGAVPRPLNIPGEEYLTTSEAFMNLERMANRVLFVGGGYISMEFAMVVAACGAEVTILQRGSRLLRTFDPDCVEALEESCRESGIRIVKNACVERIDRDGAGFSVRCGSDDGPGYRADLVVHGAGRMADLRDLDLEAGSVEASAGGVVVNPCLQSVSNPAVYAIGDAAATGHQLATTADLEGEIASSNIIDGNQRTADEAVVPSVVFTFPPLAAVGVLEENARTLGMAVTVSKGEMNRWPSSKRIGQNHSFYKIIQEEESGRILGAHLLGHNADEVINIFAMAIRLKLSGKDLKQVLWAYPTATSDLKYMVH